MTARRFGRVSALVPFPAPRRCGWWRGGAGLLLVAMPPLWGWLHGAWSAATACGMVLAALGWGAAVAWGVRSRQPHRAWRQWARAFRATVPALVHDVATLPTQQRCYEAGRRVGERLLREAVPAVPRRAVRGEPDAARRLIWWVSAQCHEAPAAFHRGLWAAVRRVQPGRRGDRIPPRR